MERLDFLTIYKKYRTEDPYTFTDNEAQKCVQYISVASRLTKRELEIMMAFLENPDTAAVAAKTGLNVRTVQNYMPKIYKKTGFRNKEELLRKLMGREIIS